MRIVGVLSALLSVVGLAACGPLNTDLHPLPTYRVRVLAVSAPPAAPGGTEVSISASWADGGAPYQVTWGFPADFERVLVTQSTTERSASVTIRLPAGDSAADFDCDFTVADGSPYRDTRHFTLRRLAAAQD